jgi:HD-GYP domain-containing protein (c-di-GMP phosphodiesterase class II)
MTLSLDVEELRVGMFVHLDLGWWAHPFALSSFLITSQDQITTIRGLGLKKLRWSPEKSRLPEAPVDAAAPTDADTGPAAQSQAAPSEADTAGAAPAAATPTVALHTSSPAAPAAGTEHPVREGPHANHPNPSQRTGAGAAHPSREAPASPHMAKLHAQRQAQHLCEAQYNEAGQAWHEAQRQVVQAPEQARQITEGLTRSLLDKMMVDQEMCVRVLAEVSGDRVSGHALNVTVISLLMGRVFGFGAQDMLDLGLGALLHDVGKLELPDRVKNFDPKLTSHEQAAYREHVALGVAHGQRMGLSEGALLVLRQHHEMADGSGFPNHLAQDRIEIGARIVALVNRYDNLCNPPQAAYSLTPHEALSLIFAQARSKFDATMLNAFIRMMGVYPPGSVVQLTDDRYATVVSVNSSRPLKPRVMVCDTAVPVEEALLLNLDGQADLGIRRSLKPTQLPAAARDYLSPRQRMVYFFEPVAAPAADAMEALAA